MVEIREVKTKKQQREFLNFPLKLYKGNPNFVPPLWMDEKKIFRSDYVYYDTCEASYFNAYRDGTMVGRISGILQKVSNEKHGERRVRFTRFDAINDKEVAKALFDAVETWALSKGMDTVCGPLGFSDLEREGLLIEGFDQLSTFEEQYNADYYGSLIESCGYGKEVDWVESKIFPPEKTDEELKKMTDFVMKRYDLHFGTAKNGKEFLKKYADGIFDLIDKSYEGLYGTVPFTPGMRKLMLDNFGLVISPKYTSIILDENEKPVCFGLAIPSLGPAFTLTRGHITPGLILRFLSCLFSPKTIDMCLIGADPEYLNRGVSAALSVAIMRMFQQHPEIRYADTLLNLEENWAIQNQWKRFKRDIVKRYRCYVKSL